MSSKKPDRRINRTRKLLQKAFHDLMGEKVYDSITVQDIIDRADIGRSTFYAHYQDKEELAVSCLLEIMNDLNQAIVKADPQGRQVLPTRGLFDHIAENPQVFQGVVHDRGMEFFFDKGEKYWAERIEERLQDLLPSDQEPKVPTRLVATAMAGTLVTMMRWWLDNKLPFSADQMAEMTDQMLLPGIWNVLGLKESPFMVGNSQ